MRSFVLGNGRSRLNINPRELRPYGKIYGCNALYREFEPDYLIAVDPKMVFEIEHTGYQNTHEVWTNNNAKYRSFNSFKYFQPSLGWSSGPSALHLATSHKPHEIYIFGFDFVGTNGNFNNVYSDTNNYKKSTDTATYYGNWERQTELVVKNNPHIKYYRVVEDGFYKTSWEYPNFRNLPYQELLRLLPTWPQKP